MIDKTIPTTLACSKDKILFHKTVSAGKKTVIDFEEEEKETFDYGEHVRYLYVSDTEVPADTHEGKKEVISKRTKNTKFYHHGGKTWTAKISSGQPFYYDKVQEKWFRTKWTDITVAKFEELTA